LYTTALLKSSIEKATRSSEVWALTGALDELNLDMAGSGLAQK